jgi:uncharacterized protein YcaQ
VDCISRMSLLQIDTINVVARSPYLVLFSRLGDYPPRRDEGDVFAVMKVNAEGSFSSLSGLVTSCAPDSLRPPRQRARYQDLIDCISRMSLLQIDTINVVARSPAAATYGRCSQSDPDSGRAGAVDAAGPARRDEGDVLHSLSLQQTRHLHLAAQGLLRPPRQRARYQDLIDCISDRGYGPQH